MTCAQQSVIVLFLTPYECELVRYAVKVGRSPISLARPECTHLQNESRVREEHIRSGCVTQVSAEMSAARPALSKFSIR